MTESLIQPYLFFGGRCEEALEFYKITLSAQVNMVMRYSDSPEAIPPGRLAPGFEDKVMHASFRVGGSVLMASDGCEEGLGFSGFSLSLALPNEDEAKRLFAALSEGGEVTMPLSKTFWSPSFGMLTDQFGIGWMVTVKEAG